LLLYITTVLFNTFAPTVHMILAELLSMTDANLIKSECSVVSDTLVYVLMSQPLTAHLTGRQ
jgi:hypothetical protein